jgi:mannose-1-phosphate guanylyltransferase
VRAILLAAGLGTRLRPLTDHIPKCMAPVNGRPLLQYWLDALFEAGVDAVLVNLHHRSELVEKFLAAHPERARIALVHEERLLGTAGTLRANRDFGRGGPLMLIHADNLCGADLRSFMAVHAARAATLPITMMTFVTHRPKECGIVIADAAGVVQEFHEKVANPPGNLASAAVFILEPTVYNETREAEDFSRDVLLNYVGRIGVFHNEHYHRDLGSIPDWLGAQVEWNGPIPQPLARDPWCLHVHGLYATAASGLRALLGDALQVRGVRGLREFRTYERFEPSPPSPDQPTGPLLNLFWSVPPGFSSRTFFETHGAPSVAMAACVGGLSGEAD